MTKLDRKFQGTLTKVKDGSVVPDDQWIVFLAKDAALLTALYAYLAECKRLGADNAQIASVRRLIADVEIWQEVHPELVKVPDIASGEKLLGLPEAP